MELVYFLLLAISSLAMSVRALTCYYSYDTSSSQSCVGGSIYCYLKSSTEDLQSYVDSRCDNPSASECTGLDSQGCKLSGAFYYKCCSTNDCNIKDGNTCVPPTTTSTTTTSTTTTTTTTTSTTITTPTTTSTSTAAPITTTTTTGKTSASSKLLPSGFLIFCLTIFSLLLVNALF